MPRLSTMGRCIYLCGAMWFFLPKPQCAIIEQETHEELLVQGGIYPNLWQIQTGSTPKQT